MKFNDVTDRLGLIQDCEFLCNLGSTGISAVTAQLQDFTRLINAWYYKVETMILENQGDWDWDDSNKTDYPILTTNLVASQQDYILPTGTLKVKRLEISYNGTQWFKATPFALDEHDTATDTTSIENEFDENEPQYRLVAQSLFIYPIPDTNRTSCLKVWVSRDLTEFTAASTTTEPGFDKAFHRILSLGASYDYATTHALPNMNAIKQNLDDYEFRLKKFYGSKFEDKERRLTPAYEDNE